MLINELFTELDNLISTFQISYEVDRIYFIVSTREDTEFNDECKGIWI